MKKLLTLTKREISYFSLIHSGKETCWHLCTMLLKDPESNMPFDAGRLVSWEASFAKKTASQSHIPGCAAQKVYCHRRTTIKWSLFSLCIMCFFKHYVEINCESNACNFFVPIPSQGPVQQIKLLHSITPNTYFSLESPSDLSVELVEELNSSSERQWATLFFYMKRE